MYKIIFNQFNNNVLESQITIYGFLFNIGFGLKYFLVCNDTMYTYEIVGMYRTTAKTFFKCLFNSWEAKRIAEWGARPW